MDHIVIPAMLPTKENISSLAKSIINKVKQGDYSALDTVIQMEAILKVCEEVRAGLKEETLNELSAHNGTAKIMGATVKRQETGTKWDFSNTPAWSACKTKEDIIAEERKTLEATLKTIPSKMTVVDPESGETSELYPGIKTSTTSFAITLGK